MLDEDLIIKLSEGPVIATLTGTIVKSYRGQPSLGSTSATRLYVNLPIPEVTDFRE
ncbi:hypothetical protein Tsubulata_037599, partial [Turnera subulata]